MTTNIRNLSLGLGAAAASSLVMFVAAPAQAVTFVAEGSSYTFEGVEATFLGNKCIASTCVDLATGGYNVTSGAVLFDDKLPIASTPGSDTSGVAKAQVKSYNATASGSKKHSGLVSDAGMDSEIKVTGLGGLFEIYWGSVDSHNVIEFLNEEGGVVSTITGTDIARQFTTAPVVGSEGYPNEAGNFGFDAYLSFAGEFDDVRLFTDMAGVGEDSFPGNGISFEVATQATAVPEPTAVLSLLAVGAIAGGSTLKRKNQDS